MAGANGSSDTDAIKERLPVAELIAEYVDLKPQGRNLSGLCPFHNEKTPSFNVSPDRDSYYCFGCGAKGDIFSFYQAQESVDFREALVRLGERVGIEVTLGRGQVSDVAKSEYDVLAAAASFYNAQLSHNDGAKEYLTNRGVPASVIESWQIGFAPEGWTSIAEGLKKYSNEELEKVGLVKKSEKGSYYDRFRNRIMFPLRDTRGRIVGFTGRALSSEDPAKYLNSPESEMFKKSSILFGLRESMTTIRRKDFVILVEGQMDVIMSHTMGYTNAVATSGTAMSQGQLELLNKYTSNIIIAYDADISGYTAAQKVWQMALGLNMNVKVAQMKEGSDPADIVLENPDDWKAVVKNASDVIEFLVDRIAKSGKSDTDIAKHISRGVIPMIAMRESTLEREKHGQYVARAIGVSSEAVMSEVESARNAQSQVQSGTMSPIASEYGITEPIVDNLDLKSELQAILLWADDGDETPEWLEKECSHARVLLGDEELPEKDTMTKQLFKFDELLADTKRAQAYVHDIVTQYSIHILLTERSLLKQDVAKSHDHEVLKQMETISRKIQNLRDEMRHRE